MMSNECNIKVINVSDIPEFPTDLGSRCLLLTKLGLNPYFNTEEEILEALEMTAAAPKYLEICLKSSRCQGFYEQFKEGKTPFFEQDNIRVAEYRGRYWVTEGKHRVCMAKRLGVEKIQAVVTQLKEDIYSRLPCTGQPGRYKFHFIMEDDRQKCKCKGEIALLWVGKLKQECIYIDPHLPAPLHWMYDTDGKWFELTDGVKVKVQTASREVKGLFSTSKIIKEIKSEVVISPGHRKTRIWLFSVKPKDKHSNVFTTPLDKLELKTLYRFGCWRKKHENRISRITL